MLLLTLETCHCVQPDTCGISMSGVTYSVDRQGGKEQYMNCRCAREVYYAAIEKKGYSRLQCDGTSGNYKTFQNFEDGKSAYCVDENGARISQVFNAECLFSFIKDVDPGTSPELICTQMQLSLTDAVLKEGMHYIFDRKKVSRVLVEQKTKPKPMYCDNLSVTVAMCAQDTTCPVDNQQY